MFCMPLQLPLLRHIHLWLIVCLSGVALACAVVVLNGDTFGLVHFELGAVRVMFSFFLGVAFSRALGPNPRSHTLPIVATPLIFAILAMVLFAPGPLGWAYDLVAVFAPLSGHPHPCADVPSRSQPATGHFCEPRPGVLSALCCAFSVFLAGIQSVVPRFRAVPTRLRYGHEFGGGAAALVVVGQIL